MGGKAIRDDFGWTLLVHNRTKSTKSFNQFASEMAELSNQLSDLSQRIEATVQQHEIKLPEIKPVVEKFQINKPRKPGGLKIRL